MAEIIVHDAVILIVLPEKLRPVHLAAKIELLATRVLKLKMKRKLEIIEEPVY